MARPHDPGSGQPCFLRIPLSGRRIGVLFPLVTLATGVASVGTLAACTERSLRRAGVGGKVEPSERRPGSEEEKPDSQSTALPTASAGDAVAETSPPTSPTPTTHMTALGTPGSGPVPSVAVTQAHPFTGKAFGEFDLGTSENVFQTDLKYKKPYYFVLKIAGEDAWFLYPSVRRDAAVVALCAAQPPGELAQALEGTYCKAGTPDAVKLKKEAALKVAKVANDALRFVHSPWSETTPPTWRVLPDPHFHEMKVVCEEQRSGPLGPFCNTFLKHPEEAASRGFVLFETENEAKYMGISLNAVYGIPVR